MKSQNLVQSNEIPLCTCRASLTVEAAVVYPLVTAFFVFLLFFFRVLQTQTQMQTALIYSARKTATEACVIDSSIILGASAWAYWKSAMDPDTLNSYIKGGSSGVDFWESDFSGNEICLVARYRIQIPIGFFSLTVFPVKQTQIVKKWTGDSRSEEDADDPYVYITPEGEAYHMSTECRYLDLSIQIVNFDEISGLRNENDHKYYPCSACAEENTCYSEVYITEYGEYYHTSLQCLGLKRTVYQVHLSEVDGRHACSKCGE